MSPPFVFLPTVQSSLRPDFQVAAQNCWVKKGGAFTGEVRYLPNTNMSFRPNTSLEYVCACILVMVYMCVHMGGGGCISSLILNISQCASRPATLVILIMHS